MIKRISLYVLSLIYILVLCCFVCVIPLLANCSFISIYDYFVIPAFFINSLISSLVIIYVYKNPQQDGSNLVIYSKPISRKKIICFNLLASLIMYLFLAVLCSLGSLFGMIIQDQSRIGIAWVFLSCFIGNMVSYVLFGSFTLLICCFLNKTLTISCTIILAILGLAYNDVFTLVPQVNTSYKISNDYQSFISSSWYADKNNIVHHSGYVLPTDYPDLTLSDIPKFYVSHAKNLFTLEQSIPELRLIYLINLYRGIVSQFLYGPLEEADRWNRTTTTGQALGSVIWSQYEINDCIHTLASKNINLTDDDYSWMSINKDTEPFVYLDTSNLSRQDTTSFVTLNSDKSVLNDSDKQKELSQILLNLEAGVQVCYLNGDLDSENLLGNLDYVIQSNAKNSLAFGYYFDGGKYLSNKKWITDDILDITPNDTEVFNYLLYEILFDENQNSNLFCQTFIGPYDDNGYPYPGDNWTFNLSINENSGANTLKLYQLVYDEITKGKNAELIQSIEKLSSLQDYGTWYMKFRYFVKQQLTGAYGFKNYLFSHDFKDANNQVITAVPWSDYFQFSFLPVYNSLDCRNYDNLLGLTPIGDGYVNFKYALGSGFLPLPAYDDGASNFDVVNYAAYPDDGNNYISSFLPIYDGIQEPSILKNLYQTYTNSATPSNTQTNNYGYFSPIGLKASSLIRDFVDKNDYNLIYYDNQYQSDYQAFFYGQERYLALYEHTIFDYDVTSTIPNYVFTILYLAIGGLLFGFGSRKYEKIDVF